MRRCSNTSGWSASSIVTSGSPRDRRSGSCAIASPSCPSSPRSPVARRCCSTPWRARDRSCCTRVRAVETRGVHDERSELETAREHPDEGLRPAGEGADEGGQEGIRQLSDAGQGPRAQRQGPRCTGAEGGQPHQERARTHRPQGGQEARGLTSRTDKGRLTGPLRRSLYARAMTPELGQLLEALEHERQAILKKLAGLSDEDARRSTVGSGTNLAGLVQHLT